MIEVVILAIIQALTEFVPVSSSGHLLAASELTSLESSLALDVALHFGTLLAIALFFFKRIYAMCKQPQAHKGLIVNIILTSVPAALFGFFFGDFIEDDARNLWVVICMLVIVGLLMIVGDQFFGRTDKQHTDAITRKDALIIGFAQALALIPGTSRSGITMLVGRSRGMNNAMAAEYAFLAGIPVIAGATLKIALENDTQQVLQNQLPETLVGVAVAFSVGWVALKVLISYLSHKGLAVFGYYRLVLAALLFIIWI